MSKFVIILDLETSGLPQQPKYGEYYNYKILKHYNSSRVVQIGYTLHKITGDVKEFVSEHEYIVKPYKFVINNARFHGITQAIALRDGLTFGAIIKKMKPHIELANLIVAHNAGFDVNVFLSEMYRRGMYRESTEFNEIPYFCSSHGTTHLLKLKYNKKKYKQPKLEELYKWLFGPLPIDNKRHTALYDAQVLSKCFIALLDKRHFVLE